MFFQEECRGLSPLKWAVCLPEDEDSGQSYRATPPPHLRKNQNQDRSFMEGELKGETKTKWSQHEFRSLASLSDRSLES